MTRRTIIAGNWKMHMGASEAVDFVRFLLPRILKVRSEVYLAPPFTSIEATVEVAKGSSLRVGAQNMSEYHKGAYTGEISSAMLKEAGATFVILGHSERRQIFHEDDEMIRRKVKWAIEQQLEPLVCIGETEEERAQGQTEAVLEKQLSVALGELNGEQIKKIVIAYEPVWAIGSGKTATPEMAEDVHNLCRTFISKRWRKELGETLPILYGGSVKPENIQALIEQPNIDGALIGGASLDVEAFAQIIHNVEETRA